MKNEIILREEKAGMAYLRPAGAAPQLTKLYELEAASAVAPKEISDSVWSVVIAADKGAIRHWFLTGVEQGYEHMLIVYDRMDYPDEPDSPYYLHSAEAVYEALSDFRHDPMCEVMEVYDLTADMEEQLSERRAWRLPDLPDEEEDEGEPLPDYYPADGLLSSGETRLAFMQRKNAEYINGQYAEDFGKLGARAIPLYVFTDDSKEFVWEKCAYILEQEYFTKATVGVVYCFNPDGTASAHSRVLMQADEEIEDSVLLPLPVNHTVDFEWHYVKFDACYAFGKDKYSPAYKNESIYHSFILNRENERLGMNSSEYSTYVDKEAQEDYELATKYRQDKERTPDNVAAMLYAAARRGHGEAMYEFAVHWAEYENNEKVAQDWYKMAAHLGHEEAERRQKN